MGLWSNLQRMGHIIWMLIRYFMVPMLRKYLVHQPFIGRYIEADNRPGSARLCLVFEELGGTFIKLGQMLALQPDILPLEYCNALFNLLDRITPFDFEEAERVFIEHFGCGPTDLFDRFEPKPIATASIGQVYIAYIGEQKVAVKIQRPSAEVDFASDIRLMAGAIWLIKGIGLKQLDWMVEPLHEFINWTREELDFQYEARYMEKLRCDTQNSVSEYIPSVYWDYTTSRILTMDFLDGVTLLNYIRAVEMQDEIILQRLQYTGFDPDQFARNIVDNFLKDAFQYGLFHADLHPANLMVLHNNIVGYIDFGIAGVLSPYLRHNLIALTLAYSRGDLDGMYNAFFKVAALDANSDIAAFRRGLQALEGEWYAREGKEQRLLKNITLVMLDLLKLSRETGVWPERDVIKYIRSAIAIDGLISRFAPTFDVGRYLETVCHRYLTWKARQDLFDFDSLINWSSANGQLMHDGMLRMAALIRHIATKDKADYTKSWQDSTVMKSIRRQAIYMSVMVLSLSVLIILTQSSVKLGVNIFTVNVGFLIITTMGLVRRLYRLL